uniref:DUF4139 domain-containing protein n=1 Tax=Macrostomum lignano TaxID=282301 RepID=A0A1I8HDX1_9PLAT
KPLCFVYGPNYRLYLRLEPLRLGLCQANPAANTMSAKERVTFSIDVNLSKEQIKFVDISADTYQFCLSPIENENEATWQGNPAEADWISVKKDQYYLIKARPGEAYQYQKIAQIVLTEKTFRVKEVDTPPNTLFMTVEQNEKAMHSIVNKIDQIAQRSTHSDNKQVLVFAEDPFYTNLPETEKEKCIWKDYTFEMDVKNCSIRFVKEEESKAILMVYKGENQTNEAPIVHIDLGSNNIPLSDLKLERHAFYTLFVKRDASSPDTPVILFKITDKTAIIRELPGTKPPVFLSYQKGHEPH